MRLFPLYFSRREMLMAASGAALGPFLAVRDAQAVDPTTPEGAPRYDLNVIVDPAARRIEGEGTITLAPADEARSQFRFALAQSLDAAAPPSMLGDAARLRLAQLV